MFSSENSYTLVADQTEQVLITGNEKVGFTAYCTSKYRHIFRIAHNFGGNLSSFDDFGSSAILLHQVFEMNLPSSELFCELSTGKYTFCLR